MRIVCAGGGPAGLYFAVLAKLADPGHEVTVIESDCREGEFAPVHHRHGLSFRSVVHSVGFLHDRRT